MGVLPACVCVCTTGSSEAREGSDPVELESDVCKLPPGAGSQMGPGRELHCTVHSYFLLSYLRQLVSFLCLPLLSFSSPASLPASLRSSCGLLK